MNIGKNNVYYIAASLFISLIIMTLTAFTASSQEDPDSFINDFLKGGAVLIIDGKKIEGPHKILLDNINRFSLLRDSASKAKYDAPNGVLLIEQAVRNIDHMQMEHFQPACVYDYPYKLVNAGRNTLQMIRAPKPEASEKQRHKPGYENIILINQVSVKGIKEQAILNNLQGAPEIYSIRRPEFKHVDFRYFQLLLQELLEYPAAAKEKNIQGDVLAVLAIEADGSMSGVRIEEADSDILADEVCRVLMTLKEWKPATRNGVPVRIEVLQPVTFSSTYSNRYVSDFTGIRLPSFKRRGDMDSFRAWLSEELNYPAEALDDKASGKAIIRFMVGKNGRVSNIEVIRSSHPAFAPEIIRVLEKSPKWKPGRVNGKKYALRFELPVDFNVN